MKLEFNRMRLAGEGLFVLEGIRGEQLDPQLSASTRSGDLTISWEGADNPVWMTGPAVTVFEGEMEIDES